MSDLDHNAQFSIKDTTMANGGISKEFDPLSHISDDNNNDEIISPTTDYSKGIWLIGCVLSILINSIICGIGIKDMMFQGYNSTSHWSMAINLIFTFSGLLAIHEWIIKK